MEEGVAGTGISMSSTNNIIRRPIRIRIMECRESSRKGCFAGEKNAMHHREEGLDYKVFLI